MQTDYYHHRHQPLYYVERPPPPSQQQQPPGMTREEAPVIRLSNRIQGKILEAADPEVRGWFVGWLVGDGRDKNKSIQPTLLS